MIDQIGPARFLKPVGTGRRQVGHRQAARGDARAQVGTVIRLGVAKPTARGLVAAALAQRHARDLDRQPRAERNAPCRHGRDGVARQVEPHHPRFDQPPGDNSADARPLALAFDPRLDDMTVFDQRGPRLADAGFV